MISDWTGAWAVSSFRAAHKTKKADVAGYPLGYSATPAYSSTNIQSWPGRSLPSLPTFRAGLSRQLIFWLRRAAGTASHKLDKTQKAPSSISGKVAEISELPPESLMQQPAKQQTTVRGPADKPDLLHIPSVFAIVS
jgi:hypothetical protein